MEEALRLIEEFAGYHQRAPSSISIQTERSPKSTIAFSPSELFALFAPNGPGFMVRDNYLGREHSDQVFKEVNTIVSDGLLRPAAMGRGSGKWLDHSYRGDRIMWLRETTSANADSSLRVTQGGDEPSPTSPELPPGILLLLHNLDALGRSLADVTESLGIDHLSFLSNGDQISSTQLAHFSGDGSGYTRHRDAFMQESLSDQLPDASTGPSTSPTRKLTAIYYLNPDWKPEHGGKLRLFRTASQGSLRDKATWVGWRRDLPGEDPHWDVEPLLDRLIIFRSDLVEHQVRVRSYSVVLLLCCYCALVVRRGVAWFMRGGLVSMRAGVAQVLAAHAPRLAVTRWYYGSPQRLSLSTGVATAKRAASLRGGDFLRFAEPNGNCRNESASATAITPVVSTQGGLDETALELEEKAHSSPIAHVSARAGPLAGACVGPELVISPELRAAAAVVAASSSGENGSDGGDVATSHAEGGLAAVGTAVPPIPSPPLPPPLPPPRIFVSVAAFRDSETGATLRSLFAAARRPLSVFAGVVWQVAGAGIGSGGGSAGAADEVVVPEEWRAQVRCLVVPAEEASGPCPARALAQMLWRGEEFFLQIDSHMRFRAGWDEYLLAALAACDSPRPILTAYPPAYTLPNELSADLRPSVLWPAPFGRTDGMPRQRGRILRCAKGGGGADAGAGVVAAVSLPIRSPLWAAGFSFSSASVLTDVPYDPHLRHLFFGEEAAMAARLFTHGYDFFAPPDPPLFHLWSRAHRPSFRQNPTAAAAAAAERLLDEQRSQRAVRALLQIGEVVPTGSAAAASASSPASDMGNRQSVPLSGSVGVSEVGAPCLTLGVSGKQPWKCPELAPGAAELGALPQRIRFGLGSMRSLDEFEAYCGVDFRRRTLFPHPFWPPARTAGAKTDGYGVQVCYGIGGGDALSEVFDLRNSRSDRSIHRCVCSYCSAGMSRDMVTLCPLTLEFDSGRESAGSAALLISAAVGGSTVTIEDGDHNVPSKRSDAKFKSDTNASVFQISPCLPQSAARSAPYEGETRPCLNPAAHGGPVSASARGGQMDATGVAGAWLQHIQKHWL